MSKFVFKHTLIFWEILTIIYSFAHNSKLILPQGASLAGVGSSQIYFILCSSILKVLTCFELISFWSYLTLGLRKGPKICLNSVFFPNKLRQTLLYNCLYIYDASFDVLWGEIWGVVWVWGSSKIMVEGGGWWNPMIFILSIA